MAKEWVYDPHRGGVKIPPTVQQRTKNRLSSYFEQHYEGKYTRIDVRFRGALCYVDAYTEPFVPEDFDEELFEQSRAERIEFLRNVPTHLCRLRYFGNEEKWSMAWYRYSVGKYDPCFFANGTFHGTPEEAVEDSAEVLNYN